MGQTAMPTSPSGDLPTFLVNEWLRLIFFCGKGGVGKTTSATAAAAFLARSRPDRQVLVFSIDPAHSVADSFGCEVGAGATAVPGFDNLAAAEIDSEQLHQVFVRLHGSDLHELADRATHFGIHELANVFSMAYPSSFAFMAMMALIEFINSGKYDLIVVDTAPTGHLIMFIELLFELKGQLDALERSQEKHRYMVTRYAGRYRKDRPDLFLAKLRTEIVAFRALLGGTRTEFVPVTIPEEMSIRETKRLITLLRRLRIWSVNNIIINGLLDAKSDCPFCTARSEQDGKQVRELAAEFPSCRLIPVSLFPHEVRGERLLEYAEFLSGRPRSVPAPRQGPDDVPASADLAAPEPATALLPTLVTGEGLRLALFCGKGGVGKTTSAAATAVQIARARNDQRVLIFSIDPAHSLSDSLDVPLSHSPEPVAGFENLWAMEVDMDGGYEAFERGYRAQVDQAFKRPPKSGAALGMGIESGTDYTFDENTLRDLVSVAPLGLSEFMAVAHAVREAADDYDVIIVDTAPTGNLIDVLRRPESILKWFTSIIRGIRNYTGMMNTSLDLTKFLLDERRLLLGAHKLFSDATRTEFVAVAIPEVMGVLETERLLCGLRNLKAVTRVTIVNKMVPESPCRFCSSKRREQASRLQQMREKFPDYQLVPMPLFPYQIRGVRRLREFADVLYGPGQMIHAQAAAGGVT